MRDERRIIINPERAAKSEDGLAKVFGVVFWAVMIVAALDYGITWVWAAAMSFKLG